MGKQVFIKLHNRCGMSRLILILLVLVLVLAIVAMVPGYRWYQNRGKTLACAVVLDSARRRLAADYMFAGWENTDAEGAKSIVADAMNGWDDLCPDGGTVYITHRPGEDLAWDLVCGLHDKDSKERTRLNADYVLQQLREELVKAHREGIECPESLSFTLHSKRYTALLTDQETGFKRGTSTTPDVEGIVAYYAISGYGSLGSSSSAKPGTICYFSYAEEAHCADWNSVRGWGGDSYAGYSH